MKKGLKKWIPSGLCMMAGIIFYVILAAAGGNRTEISPEGLQRDSYGGEEKEYELVVSGLEEVDVPLTVTVGPQIYTEEEAGQVFFQIMDQMEARIRGENKSLMEIEKDLELPSALEEYGVRLKWYSSDPELLSSTGKITGRVKENQDLTLYVQLSHRDYQAEFQIPLRLTVPARTPSQERLERLREEIVKEDELQQTGGYLKLPAQTVDGSVVYHLAQETDYIAIPFLGVAMGILLLAREDSKRRETEKRTNQELLLDYAEVVSKLMVLVGAGMTVRNAWERMVKDYEMDKKKGSRAAYEQMKTTYYQMENGTPESKAFREFGRRCKLQPYLKLSSVLEQNRKSGTKNLRTILETEMTDAFELRKNLARQMGEEAGTKLLLPLFLMLGIVMVMIMVPAMMTMG